jgi:hypothetical protein
MWMQRRRRCSIGFLADNKFKPIAADVSNKRRSQQAEAPGSELSFGGRDDLRSVFDHRAR